MLKLLVLAGGAASLVVLALLVVIMSVLGAQIGAGDYTSMIGCGAGASTLCAVSPQGDNAVTLRARAMAAHLNSSCIGKNGDCVGDAAFDSGFPQEILQFARQTCAGCIAWANEHFQCVVFVLGAYGAGFPAPADWTHALNMAGNANTWWDEYGTAHAKALGYQEIPAGGHGLPLSPGDVMAWGGGAHGHVSIVLGWTPPSGNTAGSLTFAQANGEKPFQTLPIRPDYTIDTHDGYWNGFTVFGYIHPLWLPKAVPAGGPVSIPSGLPNSPYVQMAWQSAQSAGIRPDYFVRQINRESGFDPNAVGHDANPSDRGQGIAQFTPAMVQQLGITNPWDPSIELPAAAKLMASYSSTYAGDYAEALAAYNTGPGNLQGAISRCGDKWITCVAPTTKDYINYVMGP